jgi:hypothetical protein
MAESEKRIRMTLEEAERRLKNFPASEIRHIVANPDGSFSIIGSRASESERLQHSLYDTVVVATNKTTTRANDFVHVLQAAAAEPITLRELIERLIATYRPPSSMKDPAMVIRIRTRDAYTTLGFLRRHVIVSRENK